MNDLVGQQLGNYRLIKLLGSGSYGDVYFGEHLILSGRLVAIKVLHGSIDQIGERESFLREAQVLAKLQHSSILSILDAGIYNSFPYLVTEYAPNGNVHRRYPTGTKLLLNDIVVLTKQVAAALQYAHDQALIHRDVKPENMLLNAEDAVLLSDFGIAVTASTSSQGTQNLAGTIPYMAPEQIRGKAVRASDQYSLGVVIYEWLCGRRPFEGSFTEIASQHLFLPPPTLHEVIATISPEIEHVVMKALSKTPEQRFPSIAEFAIALEEASRLVTFSPIEESITLIQEPTDVRENTNPPTMPLTVNEAIGENLPVSIKMIGEVKESPVSDATNFPGEVNESFIPNPTNDIPGQIAETALKVIVTPKDPSLLQSIQSYVVSLLPTVNALQGTKGAIAPDKPIATWQGHVQEVYAVIWSPDSKFVASAGADGTVQVWEPSTKRRSAMYHANGKVRALAWSPDAKYIASAGKGKKIQLWDRATGGESVSYTALKEVYALAWSPDGKYIASGGMDGILHIWDTRKKSESYAFKGHTDWIRAVAWSPDGVHIASAGNDKTVYVWNFSSRVARPITTFTKHTDWVRAVAWSPKGDCIASAGDNPKKDNPNIYVWNAKTGEIKVCYTGHATKWTGGVLALVWSPDGQSIVSAGEDQTVHLWNPNDGTPMFQYEGHLAPVDTLAWSPDGQKIASGSYDRRVQIWQVPSSRGN